MEGLQLNDDLLWLLLRLVAPPVVATPSDVETLGRCCLICKKVATAAEERLWKSLVLSGFDLETLEASNEGGIFPMVTSYRHLFIGRFFITLSISYGHEIKMLIDPNETVLSIKQRAQARLTKLLAASQHPYLQSSVLAFALPPMTRRSSHAPIPDTARLFQYHDRSYGMFSKLALLSNPMDPVASLGPHLRAVADFPDNLTGESKLTDQDCTNVVAALAKKLVLVHLYLLREGGAHSGIIPRFATTTALSIPVCVERFTSAALRARIPDLAPRIRSYLATSLPYYVESMALFHEVHDIIKSLPGYVAPFEPPGRPIFQVGQYAILQPLAGF